MDLTPVQSSHISAVGYDPAARVLTVQFVSGQTYRYAGVSPQQADALLGAASPGGHFHAHIRPYFDGQLIGADDDAS